MAKLTKAETKNHNKILDLIHSDKPLSHDEKLFVLENFHEGSSTNNSALGAFFTPIDLAYDFALETHYGESVVDICAGIGMLSFACRDVRGSHEPIKHHVCLELNHTYYQIGKRIVPEADWILGDALMFETEQKFDLAISNPPFGKIKTSDYDGLFYKGAEFEYKIIEKAAQIAEYGVFILPQHSANFRYSGSPYFKFESSTKFDKFKEQTGIDFEPNLGIDTSIYLDMWKGVKPLCEIVIMNRERDSGNQTKYKGDPKQINVLEGI